MPPRKTSKASKEAEEAKPKPVLSASETSAALTTEENGRKQSRKRSAKDTTPSEDISETKTIENPKKKAKKGSSNGATSFHEAEWSTLYEVFVHNQPKEKLIDLIVSIFLYFDDQNGYINEATLRNIIEFISNHYHQNYYHSFVHATHVLINISHYLINIQKQFQGHFTTIEKLAMIFTALIHDVDHFGVTNNELIKQKHSYAILYHDQSVAEMNSLAIGLNLLNDKGYELTKDWKTEERDKFRQLVIELVLCTDIADPHKKRLAYLRFEDAFVPNANANSSSKVSTSSSSSNWDETIYNISNESCRIAFLMIALRAADVSSSMQSLTCFHVWAKNFFDETYQAAANDTGPPLEIDSYCYNQISYMEGHAQRLVNRLNASKILNETFTEKLAGNINANIEDWKVNGSKLFHEWESSHPARKKKETTSETTTSKTAKKESAKPRGKTVKAEKSEEEVPAAAAVQAKETKKETTKKNKTSTNTDTNTNSKDRKKAVEAPKSSSKETAEPTSERKTGRALKRKVIFDL